MIRCSTGAYTSRRTGGSNSVTYNAVSCMLCISYKDHTFVRLFILLCRLRSANYFASSLSCSEFIMVDNGTVGCSNTDSYTVFQRNVLATGAGGAQRSEWRIQNGAAGNAWTVITRIDVRVALQCDADAALRFALLLIHPGFVPSRCF